MVVQTQDEALKTLFSDRRLTLSTLLDIDDKNRQRVPLIPNPIQEDIIVDSGLRDIYVKPAQVGFTSIIVGDFFLDNITIDGTVSVIISYDEFSAQRQILKAKRYHQSLRRKIPTIPKLDHKSATELSWEDKDTNFYSTMYIFSSRSYTIGRGEVIHNLLLDEYAFWQLGTHEAIMASAIQRVPLSTGTKIRIGCYDKDTEILTRQGWVRFPDLTDDMEIFTKDSQTNEAYYTKPSVVLKYPYNGEMLHFSGKRLDLMVTPEHDLWIKLRTSGYSSNNRFRKAQDIPKTGALFDTSVDWYGDEHDYFTLPGKGGKPDIDIPMSLWVEFLGYFLSEGWTDTSSGTWLSQNGIGDYWFVMKSASERLAGLLGAELYESSRKDRPLLEWCIRDSRLHNYLSGYTEPKILPDNIRFVKSKYLRTLIAAFSMGDGAYNRNLLYNTSLPLMNDFQEILLKLGYSTNLYPHGNTRHLEEYMLSWSTSSNVSFRHKLPEKVSYSGYVYCATVPDHLLLVRRNGKAVWCGNSTANGEDNPFCEMYRASKEGTVIGGSVYRNHFYPWFLHPEYVMYPDSPFCLSGDDQEILPNMSSEETVLLDKLIGSYNFKERVAIAQIRWRRYKIAEMASMRRSGETQFIFSQEFPEDDETCFMVAGDQAYNTDVITSKIHICIPAPIQKSIVAVDKITKTTITATLDIWHDVEDGKGYVISIDPGKGKISESVGHVWNFIEGFRDKDGNEIPPVMQHCATLAGFYDEWEMAELMKEVAHYYNTGVICPEDNLDIVSHLRDYSDLYYREDVRTGKGMRTIGWQTNVSTKPYMITEVSRHLEDIDCQDIRFWSQCKNIRRNATVRGGILVVGADDHHDCGAIAIVCRSAMPVARGYVGNSTEGGWDDRWGT